MLVRFQCYKLILIVILGCLKWKKYQKKFIEKIEETKKCWIEKEVVTRDELYRFLHSIKGTAPTIGLDRLGSIAEEKMNRLEDDNTEKWSMTTWKTFLHDLLHNTTEQSSNNQEQPDQEKQTFEKLILLVDHDPLMIKGVKELLEEEGFMVLVGLSTEKAIPIFLIIILILSY
ncbi:MAG: Hpt domain-containing protein [Bacillaceae bacterium]|nr:Hpt domain-containing protein [Bacillaceae bacterium]